MPSKQQSTGMTGLYLVAAELSTRGFIVSPTSRSAQAADLLVTDGACKHTYAVQVKTNGRNDRFRLVGEKSVTIVADTFIYGLVNLTKRGPEFYIVPSIYLSQHVKVDLPSPTRKAICHSVFLEHVANFKDKWVLFKNEDNPACEPAHRLYKSQD